MIIELSRIACYAKGKAGMTDLRSSFVPKQNAQQLY